MSKQSNNISDIGTNGRNNELHEDSGTQRYSFISPVFDESVLNCLSWLGLIDCISLENPRISTNTATFDSSEDNYMALGVAQHIDYNDVGRRLRNRTNHADSLRLINRPLTLKEQIDIEMKESLFVSDALVLGFSKDEIKRALQRQFQKEGRMFLNMSDLMDSLLNLEDTAPKHCHVSASTPHKDRFVNKANFKFLLICNVCFIRGAFVVFYPCTHVASCTQCAQKCSKCPKCGQEINEKTNVEYE